MRRDLTTSIVAAVAFTLLFGLAYPLIATGVSQVLFPGKSEGSTVKVDGKTVGSSLIGQSFTIRQTIPRQDRGKFGKKQIKTPDPKYFQPRPSASTYSPDVTFFNNLGPNNRELMQEFKGFIRAYLALERPYNPGLTRGDIPVDAVTTSASGVDPEISQANARIQAHRISKVRGISLDRVNQLIDDHTDGRALGVLGEPGVNVLELNIALDRESPQ
jgi:potassium-transporting ATPase KdpC subunit